MLSALKTEMQALEIQAHAAMFTKGPAWCGQGWGGVVLRVKKQSRLGEQTRHAVQ